MNDEQERPGRKQEAHDDSMRPDADVAAWQDYDEIRGPLRVSEDDLLDYGDDSPGSRRRRGPIRVSEDDPVDYGDGT